MTKAAEVVGIVDKAMTLNDQLNAVHFCREFLASRVKPETLDNMGKDAYASVQDQMTVMEKSISWMIEDLMEREG